MGFGIAPKRGIWKGSKRFCILSFEKLREDKMCSLGGRTADGMNCGSGSEGQSESNTSAVFATK